MTRDEAAREQQLIAIKYGKESLGWWFGTKCGKCCGVYPRFRTTGANRTRDCWYECDVCGKRTDLCVTPSEAREKWNREEFMDGQQIRFC